MGRFIDYKYLSDDELMEILKSKDEYKILRDHKYGKIKHLYTPEPWDKGDDRKINDGEFEYKINLLSYFFLESKMDDNLFDEIKKSVSVLNYDTQAASYYNIGSSTDYRDITDIFAKMLIKPGDFSYNNSSYIKQLFQDENFYRAEHNKELFTFKNSDKDDKKNIDFGKYAFISGNKLALNHIYQEMKVLKKTYQEFAFDELTINQFSVALNHYKEKNIQWPNKDNESIKNVDSLFYNIDFVMLFASTKSLNKNQSRILEFILKDSKLVEKLQKNAGKNNIYTKDKYDQRKSKDSFILAILHGNVDFINILFESGYEPNSNEKSLIHSNNLESKIKTLKDNDVNVIDIVKQKIIGEISSNNIKKIDCIYEMSDKEIEALQKDYDDFKHSVAFGKIINQLSSNVMSLYNNQKLTIVDLFILKEAYVLPALYTKGFENIHPKIEETAFNELLINKYNKHLSATSIQDTFEFFDKYLNKQPDGGINIILNVFSKIETENPFIYPIFDYYISEKISNINISPEEKAFLASSSLFLFNKLTEEEKVEFFGDETHQYVSKFTRHYLNTLSVKSIDSKIESVEEKVFLELAKLTIKDKSVFSTIRESAPSYEPNRYDSVLVKLEKAHLLLMTNDFSSLDINLKIQRRL